MEVSADSAPQHRPHRTLQTLAVLTALSIPSSDARQSADAPAPASAPWTTVDPHAPEGFPSNPHDSPLSEVAGPPSRPTTSAPSSDPAQGERDQRLLGPLTPSNPIETVASVPRDDTYSPLWWAVVILAAGQVVNTIRGLVNSPKDFSAPVRRIRNRSHFEAGRDLSSPSMNSHIFENVANADGETSRLQLSDVITKKKPKLATMINNSEAQRVFLGAAERCEQDQPFPSLEFGKAAQTTLSKIRRRLHVGSDKSPQELQQVYLRELNKIFRDAYSELHKDGLLVKERESAIRKAIISAFESNFPLSEEDKRAFERVPLVHASWHRAIWICEVKPRISRDLILADISDEMFEQFGDESKVSELLETSPQHRERIVQFRQAYLQEQAYVRRRDSADERNLFPRVKVFTDISDKTVPAFIAALLAKYDRRDLAAQLAQVARAHVTKASRSNGEEPPAS